MGTISTAPICSAGPEVYMKCWFFLPAPVCPYVVNKQQEKCVKWTHWSDLDDDVGKKSNTSGILKFFMVVGTHLCKMATLLCHPRLSRPLNVSRQIGGNHEIPLVFVSLAHSSSSRTVGGSENQGGEGASINVLGIICPQLVEIGLTDPPNLGANPRHPRLLQL